MLKKGLRFILLNSFLIKIKNIVISIARPNDITKYCEEKLGWLHPYKLIELLLYTSFFLYLTLQKSRV